MSSEEKPDVKVVGRDDRWWVVCNGTELIAFKTLRDAAILRDNLIEALKMVEEPGIEPRPHAPKACVQP